MTNELIKIDYTNSDRPTVLGRDLHEMLEVETRYNDWFPRMCEYGFEEGKDFYSFLSKTPEGGRLKQEHQLTIAMAKELCMLQRSEKGKQLRKYFIQVEEAWNTPEQVMARALQMANRMVDKLKKDNAYLLKKAKAAAPKVLFADAVAASHTSTLIGDLAKLIRQNGVEVGQNRLFQWLRDNADYLKMLTADIPTIFVGDRCPLWGKDYLRIPRSIVEWSALKTAVKPNVALLQQSSENMVIVIPAELCKKLAAIDAGMGFDIE